MNKIINMKYIKSLVYILICGFCCSLLIQTISYAADDSAVVPIDDFDNLSEEFKYLGKDYRDNYYLDMEETGLLEVGYLMINAIANMIFSFIKWVAYLLCSVFYQVMDFNIADLLSPQINAMQKSLNNAIFLPLFTLACCGAFCALIVKMLKRDVISAMLEIAKIIGVVVLSFLVIAKSDVALSGVTNITKEISLNALISVNREDGDTTTSAFAAEASGLLWKTLVHDPWISLEFGSSPIPEGVVDEILGALPQAEKRETYIESIAFDDSGELIITTMGMKNAGSRIGFLLAYIIPFLLKSLVYLLMALLQLVFQLLAVFYLILAPIVLILVLVPGYEAMLGIWLRKILESQISILIITFVMGLLIKVDSLLASMTPTYGWFIVLIFQVALGIGLFLFRDKLLSAITTMKRGASNAARGIANIQRATNPDYMMMKMGRVGAGGMYFHQRTHANYNMPRGSLNNHQQHSQQQDQDELQHQPPKARKYKSVSKKDNQEIVSKRTLENSVQKKQQGSIGREFSPPKQQKEVTKRPTLNNTNTNAIKQRLVNNQYY